MRRFLPVWRVVAALALCLTAQAQDNSALEQRLNELSGRIETLLENQETLRKQVAGLAREIDGLREKQNRPQPDYASQEDLRELAKAVREVDKKRIEDNKKVYEELGRLGRAIKETVNLPPPPRSTPSHTSVKEKEPAPDPVPEKGYEYVIQSGDTLSGIIQAYREKNIKVTMDQVLKANPGLKPERVIPGKKIFIPAP